MKLSRQKNKAVTQTPILYIQSRVNLTSWALEQHLSRLVLVLWRRMLHSQLLYTANLVFWARHRHIPIFGVQLPYASHCRVE